MSRVHQSVVYFCNWKIYSECFEIEHVPVASATHVLYAFLDVDGAGAVKFSDPWADIQKPIGEQLGCVNALKALCKRRCMPGKEPKLLFSIGGATRAEVLRTALKQGSSRQRFCKELLAIVRSCGFDGVDIDFEEVRARDENDNLLATLRCLKQCAPDLIVTVASPAGPQAIRYMTTRSIDQLVDFWHIMAYDFSGSWSQRPGPHSNLYGQISGECAIKLYLQAGATPSKLVLGCPLYAVIFRTQAPQAGQSLFLGTKGINELPKNLQLRDYERGSACAYIDNFTIAFCESELTIYEKYLFVVANGLGGFMWWECSQDHADQRSLIAAGKRYLDSS